MKKLLSVVLVLAMLASMCVYLPMGVSAADNATPETIYAEDFAGLTEGESYTLADVAEALGWTLLRGDEATTVTVTNGALVIDTTQVATDVVFQMATSDKLKANHTIQYDLVMGAQNTALANYKLFFAGVYTGTDDGENVKAVINKTTYEGYNHMSLVDGALNEGNIWAKAYKIGGGDHSQCRPESIPGGATNNTWKTVVDVTNNQVDAYAAGARMNSTIGGQNDSWADINIADYVGTGAYLRVQQGRVATVDNISIVTGGVTYRAATNVIYNQNFDNITAGDYTGAELAPLIGFQTLKETSTNNVGTATMKYSIKNGRLEILAVPHDDVTPSGYNANQQGLFGSLFLPEMENAKEGVMFEYDLTYLYDNSVTGSLNNGDTPFNMEVYGRRNDFNAHWQISQKGFPQFGFRNGRYAVDGTTYYPNSYGIDSTSTNNLPMSQGRWEDTNFNSNAGTYVFSNGSYGNTLIGSTEKIKVVLDYDNGMFMYVNGVIAIQLTPAQLETWLTTKGTANSGHTDIIGNLMNFRMAQGCHVALDNFKITVDPVAAEGPDLLLTEQSCGDGGVGFGGAEYVEVYNNSTKPLNVYDYAYVQRAYNSSLDNVGTEIGLRDITLAYPGTHTFKTVKLAEDGVTPLYTYDVTNPDYENGWIAPGEVFILWNKTDSMHNGGENAPTVITDETKANFGMGNWGHYTEAMFREALNIPDTTKVFAMYNDYNRAFNNSGSHFVGLVDRSLVQASYDPATNSGDETLTAAKIGWTDYVSSILDVTADTNSSRTVKTVTYARYNTAFNNTAGYGDVVIGRPTAALTASAMTPGVVEDDQKRAFTITMDGNKYNAYLGEDFDFNYYAEDSAEYANYRLFFAEVNGEIITDGYVLENVMEDATIERYKVAMKTLVGASVRTTGETAGLRWVTAVKNSSSHLGKLQEHAKVTKIEIGTLIARPDDLGDATLTLENTTENGGEVRKVVAYVDYWYEGTTYTDFNGYSLFAGGVGDMQLGNYFRDYCGVGYMTITVEGIGDITVYGDYVPEDQNRQAFDVIEQAILDYEALAESEGLTAEQEEELGILYAYYDEAANV